MSSDQNKFTLEDFVLATLLLLCRAVRRRSLCRAMVELALILTFQVAWDFNPVWVLRISNQEKWTWHGLC